MVFRASTEDRPTIDVPYFDEARSRDGWQGQETSLSYDRLKSEITDAMSRLGGIVHRFERGSYAMGQLERIGVQIHYSLEGPGGQMVRGRLDVAALPVKEPRYRNDRVVRSRQDKALRAALFNVAAVLRAQWVLKQLNPGYVPLLPWLLGGNGQTLTESYADAGFTRALMAPKGDWVEGVTREVDG